MTLQTVTVTWNELDVGQAPLGGYVSFRLSAVEADSTDGLEIQPEPLTYFFTDATGESGPLVANDNVSLVPAGSYYSVTVGIRGQQPYTFKTNINFANGATQTLAFLYANQAQPAAQYSRFLPLPSGGPLAGQVPVVTQDASTATEWGFGEGDKNFTLPFSAASTVDVAHNLGKYPAVSVFDSAGDQCEGAVDYTDLNNLTVSFSAPFSGTVTCN